MLKVILVQLEHKVQQVLEHRVIKDLQVPKVLLVQLEHKVQQVLEHKVL